MKKVFLLLFVSQALMAQLSNSVYPALPYSDFSAIASEGNTIYVSGECDVSMISFDAGVSWEIMEVPYRIQDIDIVPNTNGQQAVFTARDGIYLVDGSQLSITELSNNFLTIMAGNLNDMHIINNTMYVLAGGAVYSSDLDNVDWSLYRTYDFEDNNDFVRSSDCVDEIIYVGSEEGELKTINTNTGVVALMSDFGDRISVVEMVTKTLGYLDVQNEIAFVKTTDGGQNWAVLNNMPEKIQPVAFGEDILLSVNTNRFYISTDGGQSSTYVPIPEDGNYHLISDAFMRDDGMLYFCGNSNMVLSSDDFGFSLNNLNPYKRSNLNNIQIADSGVGYAIGAEGTVIQTLDGGQNWGPLELGISTSEYFSGLAVFDDGRAILGGDKTYIIENGMIVEEQDFQAQSMLHSKIDDVLIAIGSFAGSYAIYVSTDRAATWENKASTSVSYVRIHQSLSGKIYVPTNSEFVFVSEDNGESWDVEEFNFPEVRQVAFVDDDLGIFVSDAQLYITEDGGETADQIASAYLIDNLKFFNKDQIMYTTAQNGETQLRFSDNGGSSFSTAMKYCSRTRDAFFDGDQTLWLAQEGGHINKQTFDIVSAVYDAPMLKSTRIYPNLINVGQTNTIKLQTESELKYFELINLMGERVHDSNIAYSNNKFQIDELSPGHYFLNCVFDEGRQSHMIVVQ